MAELRQFAERVLMGATLGDKLHDPGVLADAMPGAPLRGHVEPARTAGLHMVCGAAPFPSDTAMREDGARGRALHFFANHELLALELMALALLRFPDAPAAFRRGLAATMRDEQRHMALYMDRMAALGTTFGELALGGFFWRTVADLDSVRGFVAHMSLTFEQANLDHARYYADRFAQLGDAKTAAVMEEVHADEVRHVALGVHWFRQCSPHGALLAAHRDALVAPVSLRRARGRVFDAAGRRAAGLPEAYIEAVANIPTTRGKPPVVHVFDPTTELQLAHRGGYTPDAAARARTLDLETLPLLYARPDDAVLVRRAPTQAFVASLRDAGFSLAEIVVADLDRGPIDPGSLAKIDRVQPWGWTPQWAKRLAPLRARALHDPVPALGWPADVFDKMRGVAVLRRVLARGDPRLDDPATVGVRAPTVLAAQQAIDRFTSAGSPTVVLKALLGTAGRGMIRIVGGVVAAAQRNWIARTVAQQGAVVVEPWRDRVCDLSLRLSIGARGRVQIDGVGRFLVDARGQYLGAVLGRPSSGLARDVQRFLHGDGRDRQWLGSVWATVAEEVARELAPSGYQGTVGVDAIVLRDALGALRLRPVVELNTRVHMGHVAVHLAKRVAAGSVGLWRLCRGADAQRLGCGSLLDYAAALRARHPLRMSAEGRQIRAGVLPTNDASQARAVLGVLAVAPKLADAEAMLGACDGPLS